MNNQLEITLIDNIKESGVYLMTWNKFNQKSIKIGFYFVIKKVIIL